MARTGGFKEGVPFKWDAADTPLTGRFFVTLMRWVGATTAAHALLVRDTAGSDVWQSVADAANFVDVHPINDWVNGITVQTMTSGVLYVYVK